ncbi:hypothetical protein M9H77_03368 [Catharanthus roseus]|uniref:Uncharacterized protein n=1 Tax=Catharanthus roseus TaxID=4058 RepID=A0ACC0CB78_CATRO|nr:hypothetical protein M9H77_03368 [Catharanthus roseus]
MGAKEESMGKELSNSHEDISMSFSLNPSSLFLDISFEDVELGNFLEDLSRGLILSNVGLNPYDLFLGARSDVRIGNTSIGRNDDGEQPHEQGSVLSICNVPRKAFGNAKKKFLDEKNMKR